GAWWEAEDRLRWWSGADVGDLQDVPDFAFEGDLELDCRFRFKRDRRVAQRQSRAFDLEALGPGRAASAQAEELDGRVLGDAGHADLADRVDPVSVPVRRIEDQRFDLLVGEGEVCGDRRGPANGDGRP